jgi:putative hemolysin
MALLTLWQGIGAWIRRHPECRRLFGPVSISASYQNVSRLLLVQALTDSALEAELAPFVRPRRPLRDRQARAVRDAWRRLCIRQPEQISDLIASLEPDGKGVPVLLRQYLRLGGRIAAFNVDPQFSNVIDGLIVVDLLRTERQLLERYLTPSGAREFLDFHAARQTGVAASD